VPSGHPGDWAVPLRQLGSRHRRDSEEGGWTTQVRPDCYVATRARLDRPPRMRDRMEKLFAYLRSVCVCGRVRSSQRPEPRERAAHLIGQQLWSVDLFSSGDPGLDLFARHELASVAGRHDDEQASVDNDCHDHAGPLPSSSRRASAAMATESTGGRSRAISLSFARAAKACWRSWKTGLSKGNYSGLLWAISVEAAIVDYANGCGALRCPAWRRSKGALQARGVARCRDSDGGWLLASEWSWDPRRTRNCPCRSES
jgi:hypothetical protein